MQARSRSLRFRAPALVALVERGETRGELVREVVRGTLQPLIDAEVDTVVLGCTHYVFLRDAISEVMGPDVTLVDSGTAVARQLGRVLREAPPYSAGGAGEMRFLTTGDTAEVQRVVERLWGEPLPVLHADLA